MDERHAPDDGTDEVIAQLRRYADAAEHAVPDDVTVQHHPRRARWRPLAAAAAIVALVAGGTFAVISLDDDRTIQTLDGTVPAPLPDPAPDPENTCPAPRADGPRVDDLHVPETAVMVGVTSETTRDEQGDIDSIRIDIGDGGAEVRVTEIGTEELAETFPADPDDDQPVTFELCDPFAASDRRSSVRGSWGVDQERRLRADVGLTEDGRAWLVTASTPLDRPDLVGEPMEAARADLRRLIAQLSWPGPDVCANEPAATVADHQLLALPDGYALGEAESVDTGAVDMGGEQWTTLPLLGPDGARIQVISISTPRFAEALANNAVGAEPGSLTIERCHTSGGLTAPVEELTEIRRSADRIVVGAQEWEYGGWMVIGTGGATEDDVVAVAEALRS